MPDLFGDYAGRFVTEVSNEFVSLFQVAANSMVSALFGSFLVLFFEYFFVNTLFTFFVLFVLLSTLRQFF